MALRDARKAFTTSASTKSSITPLSKIHYPDHFLKYKNRKRIRDFARQYKYDDLEDDDFIKISIQKEVMLMATLDPFLTLWWLHATGLDKYIWGRKYKIQKSMIKDIEEKRTQYLSKLDSNSDQDSLFGWMLVQQIMTSSAPQPQT